MEKYFSDGDIDSLLKYCPGTLLENELKDENTKENVSRLIQLLLNSDLHLHVDDYKDNVRYIAIPSAILFTHLIFSPFKDFASEKNVFIKH